MNPDRRPSLNVTALRNGFGAPWRHLEVVAETGSTNADLIARAAAGEDIDGVVLIAEHQTAGTGRMGRTLVGGTAGTDHAVGRGRRP